LGRLVVDCKVDIKFYTEIDDDDDDDKLYLTTLTLSAKACFHNWRVNKSKFTKKDKGSKKLHAYTGCPKAIKQK
jgi:hypothetical protein